ncbi:restriction endonuclease subunit S [Neisseria yangbaofengii]|uniref:restriction endonuclease subunit S n=1 Tax=Neisseria yangbaofengii TaxID=2709396 RepID=UPI0013EAC0D0|nr:restriction endonuclease subunit S [Neisseria yangbaofengii]
MNKWKEYSFSDIAEFISTKTALSEIETEQYISTENMIPNLGGVTIATALPDMDRCNSFQERDILFSNIRTYFKKVWFAQFSGGCSADVLVIRSKNENILLNEYLYLLICSEDFINYTVVSSKGTKMPRGDKKAILNFKLNIPPIPIQRNYINQYFKLNEKIQLNTEINQTLEQMAQTVFKSWFVNFDPVRSKAAARAAGADGRQVLLAAMQTLSGVSPTVLAKWQHSDPEYYRQLEQLAQAFPDELEEIEGFGEVPKGWNVLDLNQLFEFIGGSQPPKSEHIYEEQAGYERFVQNRDFSNDNHRTYIPISKRNKLCEAKDILMDKYGEAGKVRYGIKGAYNVALAKIEPKQENIREFLRCYFTQEKIQAYLAQASVASTRNSLNSSTFIGMKTVLPCGEILSRFENMVSQYIDKNLQIKQENIILANLRDTLLPKLLNGEIELCTNQ